jgi:hypothetical protein
VCPYHLYLSAHKRVCYDQKVMNGRLHACEGVFIFADNKWASDAEFKAFFIAAVKEAVGELKGFEMGETRSDGTIEVLYYTKKWRWLDVLKFRFVRGETRVGEFGPL